MITWGADSETNEELESQHWHDVLTWTHLRLECWDFSRTAWSVQYWRLFFFYFLLSWGNVLMLCACVLDWFVTERAAFISSKAHESRMAGKSSQNLNAIKALMWKTVECSRPSSISNFFLLKKKKLFSKFWISNSISVCLSFYLSVLWK